MNVNLTIDPLGTEQDAELTAPVSMVGVVFRVRQDAEAATVLLLVHDVFVPSVVRVYVALPVCAGNPVETVDHAGSTAAPPVVNT